MLGVNQSLPFEVDAVLETWVAPRAGAWIEAG